MGHGDDRAGGRDDGKGVLRLRGLIGRLGWMVLALWRGARALGRGGAGGSRILVRGLASRVLGRRGCRRGFGGLGGRL